MSDVVGPFGRGVRVKAGVSMRLCLCRCVVVGLCAGEGVLRVWCSCIARPPSLATGRVLATRSDGGRKMGRRWVWLLWCGSAGVVAGWCPWSCRPPPPAAPPAAQPALQLADCDELVRLTLLGVAHALCSSRTIALARLPSGFSQAHVKSVNS